MPGWAGWRAVLPGRLPAIGPVAQTEGLWVATGFASRGLTWSSLAGDLIAGALSGEPLALERDIMDKISQT
jgi:tRNA 5-methylaminomethyl-2-thiouridine biosynthesis bifunctional protein